MKINFIEYWVETVDKYPDKIAVIQGDRKVTIKELDRLAKNICTAISLKSTEKNKPIAVYLPKSIESIYVNIGIMYSGNFYMNLDVKSPLDRTRNAINFISPEILITNNAFVESVGDAVDCVINTDDLGRITAEEFDPKYVELIDVDPICLINTSGSTGVPKGVVLNHRSFIDFYEWAINEFNFKNSEVIGSLSPIVFDIYCFELTLLMGLGSTIVIIPEGFSPFPVKILDIIESEKVSFIFWVPTIMVNIANLKLLEERLIPDLRLVWFAGEVFPTKQFNYWYKKIQQAVFVNMYGPIEITLDCTFHIINQAIDDNDPIPIGKPCRNTDLIILDENNNQVLNGCEGELCVRGTSLAMGYYGNLDLTNRSFIQNPLNKHYPEIIYKTGDIVQVNSSGDLLYKGRKDTLIKHSGYRIELMEIEHATVNRLGLVENCCVVYNEKDKEIIMAYQHVAEIQASLFRKELSTFLPMYMIPKKFIQFKQLPMNVNGKIDRLKIKADLC